MAMRNKDFTVFILTHGRPDKIYTERALRRFGYTGRVYFVIDNEDKTADEYYRIYGKDRVIMFDKKHIASETEEFDNFQDRRAIIYARNACFKIAQDLGITYFLQLDDDYRTFAYRLILDGKIITSGVKDLDTIFDLVLDYYKSIPAKSIAFAQGGDFIGGLQLDNAFQFSKRKAMNTFFCSTERPFKFIGRINEDVNTYTSYQSKGNVFLTIQNICITQQQTQVSKGGMSDIYKDSGTYIKSFYTLICAPSCTKIKMMQAKNKNHNRRLHHSIDWDYAVPAIISDKYKKL